MVRTPFSSKPSGSHWLGYGGKSSLNEYVKHETEQRDSHSYNSSTKSSQVLPWRKALYEGPATVQISMVDAALVLQIAQEGSGPYLDTIPFMNDILGDSDILKVGVGLDQDMLELIRWQGEEDGGEQDNEGSVVWKDEIVGRFDIGGIGGRYGATMSLKSLAKTVCGVDLPKEKKLSFSNWAQSPRLSSRQLAYAARDAWVSAAVLEELSLRDPIQFSTKTLLERVQKEEHSIHDLNETAMARKKAKTELQSILGKKNERVDRKDLTIEQLTTLVELEQIIKELAPPHPIIFDMEALDS